MRPVLAPAKLTVTLRVTGVRADGYHELDAEMVTLSLADELLFDEGRSGLVVEAEAGARADDLPRAEQNLVARALEACGRTGRSASRSASLWVAGSAAARPTPPPCCAGPSAQILRWPRASGPDVPFCLEGGRARVEGRGSASPRWPSRPASTCYWCRRSASTRRGCTGPGTKTPGTRPRRADFSRPGRRAAPGPLARRTAGPGG